MQRGARDNTEPPSELHLLLSRGSRVLACPGEAKPEEQATLVSLACLSANICIYKTRSEAGRAANSNQTTDDDERRDTTLPNPTGSGTSRSVGSTAL